LKSDENDVNELKEGAGIDLRAIKPILYFLLVLGELVRSN
jgi:hypothetical protein